MAKSKSKVDLDEVMAAVEADDNSGFCIACGFQQDGCEPDAREYECEECGERKVYGAAEILLMSVA